MCREAEGHTNTEFGITFLFVYNWLVSIGGVILS